MNGVNLIPAARREMWRKNARVRVWMCVAPLCASILAGAYGYLRMSWETSTDAFAADVAKADAQIKAVETETAKARAKADSQRPVLSAAKAVGEQPDWSLLLAMLASSLGDQAVLSSCVLEPAPEPAAPSLKPGAKPDAPPPKDSARPARFTLALTGLAGSQDAVALMVTSLESKKVFDNVTIVEARRATLSGHDAVNFRIECVLSDAGGAP
jgi:Fimbrial assembly protein (PilN)